MKKLVIPLLVCLLCAKARADVPAFVPFQGFLTDENGAPIDATVSITFKLYDDKTLSSGGHLLFTEVQSVTVDQGYFNVYIGATTALDPALLLPAKAYFLGVEVGSDGEMTPRTELASVPYAFYANQCGDAATVGGVAPSAFAVAGHTHPAPSWGTLTGVPAGLLDGDDDTTYAAGGGLALTGTTFSVDTSQIQSRVAGACLAGSSIRAINQNGTVVCEDDDDTDTLYSVDGTTLSMDGSNVLSVATGGISATQLAADAVESAGIKPGAVSLRELGNLPSGAETLVMPVVQNPLLPVSNDLLAVGFTPSAAATCIASASLALDQDGTASEPVTLTLIADLGDGAGVQEDSQSAAVVLPVSGQKSTTAASSSALWTVLGGDTAQLGCRATVPAGASYAGMDARCRVTWLCH